MATRDEIVDAAPAGSRGRGMAAQPHPFWNLVFTEFWERFSFYGLQAILTFYLLHSLTDGGLELSPVASVSIVGAYGGSVYLAQVCGAWIADRVLAPRLAILVGAVIIMAGHVSLAVVPGLTGLAAGLTSIAVGTGLLKVNISAMVGLLYRDHGRVHQDAGFSYFYMGINTGAVLGPLLTGYTQSRWGFHLAFGIAAVGMLLGLLQYCLRYRTLPEESRQVKNPVAHRHLAVVGICAAAVVAVMTVLIASGMIGSDQLNYVVGVAIFAVVAAYFTVMLRTDAITADEKHRVRGYLPLWIADAVYYGLLLQIFTTIPLFVTDRVDLHVGGWRIPEAWFSFVGILALVVALALMGSVWKHSPIGRMRTTRKFASGLALVGVAYLLMTFTEFMPGRTVSPFFIAFCLTLASVTEVFIGPIGLSLVTRIAPQKYTSQMVALKILALGAGSTIAGLLGALYTAMPTLGFFLLVGAIGLGGGAVVMAISAPIERACQSETFD